MKILYIVHQFYPHYGSGTEKVTFNIASMIQNAGNKVKVITYRVNHNGVVSGEFKNIKYHEFIYRKIPVLEFFLEKEPPKFTVDLINEDVLSFAKEILKKEKPDLVHVCHPMRVCSFLEAAEQMGIPCVVTATDLMYICPKIVMTTTLGDICTDALRGEKCNLTCYDVGNRNEERMALSERLLSKADSIVVPSIFIGNMIKKQMPNLDIRVIKHGMDYTGVKQQIRNYRLNDCINFAFVGSIQEHKGIHILIDEFMKIKANNIRLSIYGKYDDNFGQKLLNYAKKDERIRFNGAFEASMIDRVYEGLDVLVIPSICYESYSLVKHEAIMRNIPIIVSDIGALGDGIIHGVNGYKFSIAETKSLREIITSIANNPEQLNEIKKNLVSFVVPTIEQESFQYLTLYKKCIATHMKGDKSEYV